MLTIDSFYPPYLFLRREVDRCAFLVYSEDRRRGRGAFPGVCVYVLPRYFQVMLQRYVGKEDRTPMLRFVRVFVLLSALLVFFAGPVVAGPLGPNSCSGDHDIPQAKLDLPVFSFSQGTPPEEAQAGDWTAVIVQVCMWLQGL